MISLSKRKLWSLKTHNLLLTSINLRKRHWVVVRMVWCQNVSIWQLGKWELAKQSLVKKWRIKSVFKQKLISLDLWIILTYWSSMNILRTPKMSIWLLKCAPAVNFLIRLSKRSILKNPMRVLYSNKSSKLLIIATRRKLHTEILSRRTSFMRRRKKIQTLKLLILDYLKFVIKKTLVK